MLRLGVVTDAAWTARILQDLDAVLLDQAHLERKAAAGAVKLLVQYPDRAPLQAPLARLAREELAHFEELLRALAERGVVFRPQRPSLYFRRLHELVRGSEPGRLLDRLLCHAFIEARSCERLSLLAQSVSEPALARLYRGLLSAEVRHHSAYVDLARELFGDAAVAERLGDFARHEASVLAASPARARLHDSGRPLREARP